MEELQKILDIDRKIAEKESALKSLKTEIDLLKIDRDKQAIAAAEMLSEVGELEHDGIRWKTQKPRPSVQIREGIKADILPPEFVRIAPDKVAMMKAYKEDPSAIAPYAEVIIPPAKITYKVL